MFVFHHVGCVVRSIEKAASFYRPIASGLSETFVISSQGVRVAFLELSPGSYLELVEPDQSDSIVASLLNKRFNFYHIGLLTDSFDDACESLEANGHVSYGAFESEAFEMRRCAFLGSPLG